MYSGAVSKLDARIANWFLIAAEALQKPIVAVPVEILAPPLLESFRSSAVTYNERNLAGTVLEFRGFTTEGTRFGGSLLDDALRGVAAQMDDELLNHHPLLRWHLVAGSNSPQTLTRVPSLFTTSAGAKRVYDVLRTYDIRQQLSMPLEFHGQAYHAIVLNRFDHRDFSDNDVTLAQRIQAMFVAFQRQADILGAAPVPEVSAGILTGRELAALRCLALGLTSRAIASRLYSSPRTVEKHLQNAYRKLGVHDRVSAMLVAQELGLIAPPLSRNAPPSPADAHSG